MAFPLNRWWVLVAGVVLAWAAMLSVRHVPGLAVPKIGENRVLAGFPGKPEASAAGLREYREAMDAYVIDHFPARPHFIAGINLLRYRLGYSGTARVIVGRDGWLFYDNDDHLSQLRGSSPLKPDELRAWIDTLAERTHYLRERDIPFLVVSAPLQERIYPEKAPLWAQPTGGVADTDALEAAARAAGLDSFLSLYPVLLAQKERYPDAYTGFDTHWTGRGAHGAYVAMLDAMRARGIPVAARPLSSFTALEKPTLKQPQNLAVMLGLASFVTQVFPQYTDPSIEAGLRVHFLTQRQDWAGTRVIDTGVQGAPVLMITGDSFSSELLPFLYPHFSRLIFSHYDEGYFRTDLIERFKPDVAVLEMLESGLRYGMDAPISVLPAKAVAPQAAATDPMIVATPANLVAFAAGPRVVGDGSEALPGYRCGLELIVPATDTTGQALLQVSGWMAQVEAGDVGDAVELVLQSELESYRAPLALGQERPDVAVYFKQPGVALSGFSATLAMPPVPDPYQAYLVQQVGERSTVCQTHVSITLP